MGHRYIKETLRRFCEVSWCALLRRYGFFVFGTLIVFSLVTDWAAQFNAPPSNPADPRHPKIREMLNFAIIYLPEKLTRLRRAPRV